MTAFVSFITDNIQWLVGISALTMIGLIVLVPIIVINMPTDYFVADKRQTFSGHHPVVRIISLVIKNILGGLLAIAGLIMLVTPGQGLLTLLVGLIIMNYPGKYRLERWMISRLRILPAINWLRTRYHREPIRMPSPSENSKQA